MSQGSQQATGTVCGAAAHDMCRNKKRCRSTGSWQCALPVLLQPTSGDAHKEGTGSRCEEQQTQLMWQHWASLVPPIHGGSMAALQKTHSNDRLCMLGGALLLQLTPQREGSLQLASLAAGNQQRGAHFV